MSDSGNEDDKRRAAARERQRVKRRDATTKRLLTAAAPATRSHWIKLEYKYDAAVLQQFGPHVIAEWAVPDVLAAYLLAHGRPVPRPVVGHMLVDTGASSTSIAEEVALELGLTQIDSGTTYGAHGAQASRRFLAKFRLHVPDGVRGQVHVIERQMVTTAIHDMQALYDAMGVRQSDGAPVRPIGLLGRDFLRHAKLTYHGTGGRFELAISLESATQSVGR